MIILITAGLNIYEFCAVSDLENIVTQKTESIISEIHEENFEEAYKNADLLFDMWSEKSENANMLISHERTKEISLKIIALKEYLFHKQPGEACEMAEQVKLQLKIIKEQEIPRIFNIL